MQAVQELGACRHILRSLGVLCLVVLEAHLLCAFQVHDMKYSNDGQRFLVASGTAQIKMFDRDGADLYDAWLSLQWDI